ncbi:MAG TPA: hypothetical protein VGI24_08410 [Solirubrobacteraceae bacterium]
MLALSGRAVEASGDVDVLLRRNLLIYGLGGIIAPFIGIKLIDLVVHNVLGAWCLVLGAWCLTRFVGESNSPSPRTEPNIRPHFPQIPVISSSRALKQLVDLDTVPAIISSRAYRRFSRWVGHT